MEGVRLLAAQGIRGADVNPRLSKNVCVDFVFSYKVCDEVTQVVRRVFGGKLADKRDYSWREKITGGSDVAGLGFSWFFVKSYYFVTL